MTRYDDDGPCGEGTLAADYLAALRRIYAARGEDYDAHERARETRRHMREMTRAVRLEAVYQIMQCCCEPLPPSRALVAELERHWDTDAILRVWEQRSTLGEERR